MSTTTTPTRRLIVTLDEHGPNRDGDDTPITPGTEVTLIRWSGIGSGMSGHVLARHATAVATGEERTRGFLGVRVSLRGGCVEVAEGRWRVVSLTPHSRTPGGQPRYLASIVEA